MEIKIRGGGDEVGRSNYHIITDKNDFFVDCGLKQETPVKFPDFTDIGREQIDGVFITHAHMDHLGGLPYLERKNYLKKDAKIYATYPTSALAEILLYDGLKLHKIECNELDRGQKFNEKDVEAVLNRFKNLDYGEHSINDLKVRLGSNSHLLGSTWISITHRGNNLLFSGDLGGRSGHLKEIEEPPRSNNLFIESTYGDTLQHPSLSDARKKLFQVLLESVKSGKPVLVPSFAVGRSQEILQILREREHELPDETEVIYDGMVADSMKVYETFATNLYMNEKILNYKLNSGDSYPFMPGRAYQPETNGERDSIFDGRSPNIAVVPSGMLEGGWSPYYLIRMVQRYDEATIVFPGYQVEGTVGRRILNAKEEGKNKADVTVTALMRGKFSDDPDAEGYGFHDRDLEVPTGWVESIDGFSAHADGNSLLEFARECNPSSVYLVHGDEMAAGALKDHFESNLNASVQRTEVGDTIRVEGVSRGDVQGLRERVEELERRVRDLEDS